MITAKEARKLTNENGREEIVKLVIQGIEKKIEEACSEGMNYIPFGTKEQYGGESYYVHGKWEKLPEVREHFLKQGFTFKDTGYIGGVYQHTERMYW